MSVIEEQKDHVPDFIDHNSPPQEDRKEININANYLSPNPVGVGRYSSVKTSTNQSVLPKDSSGASKPPRKYTLDHYQLKKTVHPFQAIEMAIEKAKDQLKIANILKQFKKVQFDRDVQSNASLGQVPMIKRRQQDFDKLGSPNKDGKAMVHYNQYHEDIK